MSQHMPTSMSLRQCLLLCLLYYCSLSLSFLLLSERNQPPQSGRVLSRKRDRRWQAYGNVYAGGEKAYRGESFCIRWGIRFDSLTRMGWCVLSHIRNSNASLNIRYTQRKGITKPDVSILPPAIMICVFFQRKRYCETY